LERPTGRHFTEGPKGHGIIIPSPVFAAEGFVEIISGADEGQVGEGPGKIAEGFALRAG
jgi:hypothetical protein